MRFPILALILAVAAPSNADDRGATAVIHTGPTINTNAGAGATTNNVNTNVGNVNTINTNTGVSDFSGTNPGAMGTQPQMQTGPDGGPQRLQQNPGAGIEPTAANPRTSPENGPGPSKKLATQPPLQKGVPQTLEKSVQNMGKPENAPQGSAATGDAAADLSQFFDAAHKYDAKVAGPNGSDGESRLPAGGAAQTIKNEIVQNVRIANDAGTHPADVPGLYLAGLSAARKAAEAGRLSSDMAAAVAQKIATYAAEKAKTSLGELAASAYQAAAQGPAGERDVERAVGSKPESGIGSKPAKAGAFDQWQQLLGRPGKPLISNLERLKKDVWRAQEEAAKAAPSSRVATRATIKPQDGAYFAMLPNSSVSRLPELAAQLSLGQELSAPKGSELAQYERESTFGNAFRLARRSEGLASAVFGAAVELWHRFWDALFSLFGPAPEQSLAKLSRAPTVEEKEAAPTGAAFVDFSGVNSPYLEAQRILARPGAITAAQARKALALARRSAEAAAAVTGSRAGVRSIESLASRFEKLAGGAPESAPLTAAAADLFAPSTDGGLPARLERIQASAMARLDDGAFKTLSKQNGGSLVYADLSGQSATIRVYLANNGLETAAGLAKLGFRVEKAGGTALAIYDWDSGSDASASLTAAMDFLNGKTSPEAAPRSDEAEISRVVASYLSRTGKDRLADFQSADPTLSRFSPAEIVQKGPRGFWVERARRKLDGKVQDLYLLRDLRTRRPVFGAALPLPAH